MVLKLIQHIKAWKKMAKNLPKRGKSVRNGNAPSPYSKYGKRPHQYSTEYNTWKRNKMAGRGSNVVTIPKLADRGDKREMLDAAE